MINQETRKFIQAHNDGKTENSGLEAVIRIAKEIQEGYEEKGRQIIGEAVVHPDTGEVVVSYKNPDDQEVRKTVIKRGLSISPYNKKP